MSNQIPSQLKGTIGLLDSAKDELLDRAVTYDSPEGEKSMAATVDAFNIICGRALLKNGKMTEAMGWEFMSLLKKVRQFSRDTPHLDSAVDDVAYTAFAGSARISEGHENEKPAKTVAGGGDSAGIVRDREIDRREEIEAVSASIAASANPSEVRGGQRSSAGTRKETRKR